jgi:hypothetical protein
MRGLWLVVFAMACGSKKEQPAASTGSGSGSAATAAAAGSAAPAIACPERVAKFKEQMNALGRSTPGFLPFVQGIRAPEAANAKPFDQRGVIIAVTNDGGIVVQGRRLASAAEALDYISDREKRMLEDHAMGGSSTRNAHWPLYIWADRDAPAGVIADLVGPAGHESDDAQTKPGEGVHKMKKPKTETLSEARKKAIEQARAAGVLGSDTAEPEASSHWLPRLIVAGKDAPPRLADSPDVAAIASKLPASEPEATTYVAEQLRGSIGTCELLITEFASADSGGEPAKEVGRLAVGLPSAYAKCDCNVANADAFEWGARTMLGAWAPPLAWVDMPKLTAGDKQPISALVK